MDACNNPLYKTISLTYNKMASEKENTKYDKLSRVEITKLIECRNINKYMNTLSKIDKLQELLIKDDETRLCKYKCNTYINEITKSIYDAYELDEKEIATMICQYIIRFTGSIYIFKDLSIKDEIKNNNRPSKIFISKSYIGCINRDFYIHIYDIYNGNHIWTYKSDKQINDATFHPNEKLIAIITSHQIEILNIKSQNIIQIYDIPKPYYTMCITYNTDGRYLACGTNKCIYLYDLADGTCNKLSGQTDLMCQSIVFSPDSNYITRSIFNEPYVMLWSVKTGRITNVYEYPTRAHLDKQYYDTLAFFPDSKHMIVKSPDYYYMPDTISIYQGIYDEKQQKKLPINYFTLEKDLTHNIILSPDGKYIVTPHIFDYDASNLVSRKVYVYSYKDYNYDIVHKIRIDEEYKNSSYKNIYFTPCSNYLIMLSYNNIINVYRLL